MARVEQLLVGYMGTDSSAEGRFAASGSVTLIRDDQFRILVDVGDPWNGGQLLDELTIRSITRQDVTHVVVTHGHIDHVGNLNLFPNARILMDGDDAVNRLYGSIQNEEQLTLNVQVVRYRGHTASDLCVFVRTADNHVIAVVGDLFERADDENLWRFPVEQEESRRRILDAADVIIPGHGSMFTVEAPKDPEPCLPEDIE